MLKILYASAALAGLVAPACADNTNWQGFYAGAELGAGFSTPGFSGASNVSRSEFNDNAFVGGVYLGHDWQSGNFVYGGVANVDFLGFHDQTVSHPDPVFGGKTDTYKYDLDWVASARARAGYLASNQFLLYGTAGVAVTRIEASSAYSGFGGVTDTVRKTRFGGAFGAGAEYAFAPHWSFKTEYIQYLFEDVHAEGGGTSAASFKPSFGTLNFGIAYRF
ncbi:MAG: outer membrane beta-barrel protein [Pseudomonadota bacterium]|jgi:outer membrane immunogenic protein